MYYNNFFHFLSNILQITPLDICNCRLSGRANWLSVALNKETFCMQHFNRTMMVSTDRYWFIHKNFIFYLSKFSLFMVAAFSRSTKR